MGLIIVSIMVEELTKVSKHEQNKISYYILQFIRHQHPNDQLGKGNGRKFKQ